MLKSSIDSKPIQPERLVFLEIEIPEIIGLEEKYFLALPSTLISIL
jgi:hypothetical protein